MITRRQKNANSIGMNHAWYVLLVIVAACLFYIFSVKAHFLGDSLTLISNMANPDFGIKYRNFGEAVIHMQLVKWLGSYTKEAVAAVYRGTSIIAGIGFVIILCYYSSRITSSKISNLVFIFLNLISAIIVLYYGYAENYSFAVTMIYWMILSGAASLRNDKKSIIPIITFLLAVFLHLASIVYLPGIVAYLLLTYAGQRIRKILTVKFKIIVTMGIVLFILVYIAIKLYGPMYWMLSILPILRDQFTIDDYYLLSHKHLIDFLNLLIFLAPVSMVVGIERITLRKKCATEGISRDMVYLAMMSISCILIAFVIEPDLGMARDWDLMSFLLVSVIVWGIYAWANSGHQYREYRISSAFIDLLSLSIFIPWLALHNLPESLYSYAMAAMRLDPKHSYAGLIIMHTYNKEKGNLFEAAEIGQFCRETLPERILEKKAAKFYAQGEFDNAIYYFSEAIKENPQRFSAYLDLSNCYIRTGKPEKAIKLLEIADGLNPYNGNVNLGRGQAYQLMGDTAKALDFYRKSIRCNSAIPEPYILIGEYYLNRLQPDSALAYLTILPDSAYPTRIFYSRGLAYILLGATLNALKDLNRYMHYGTDDRIMKYIESLLDKVE